MRHGTGDLAAARFTQPSDHDVDQLSSSVRRRHGNSPARCPGADQPLRFPGCATPVAPNVSGMPPPAMAMSIDRWCPGIGLEPHRGLAGDCPFPVHAPTGDRTPVTPIKGMLYSGEIGSLIRDPEIATLGPGMRFPGN